MGRMGRMGRIEPIKTICAMGLNIIIPKFTKEGESLPAWMERGLREGNFLHRMLGREQHRTQQRLVHVAQPYRNYERRRGSEFELLSVMDARTYQRWHKTDPGILEDPGQFKKLVRDNPVMTPWRP